MRVNAINYKSLGLSFNGNIYTPFSFESPVEIGTGTSIFKDVCIGAHTYINGGVIREHVEIGRFCSIADGVIIGAPNHATDLLSTHPFATKSQSDKLFGRPFLKTQKLSKSTIIGNDVWLGVNVVIIEGVTIGTGAVIGAGAVVTKDVPPYAICVGVPAKVIDFRFPPELIKKLIDSKWWMYSKEFLTTLPTNNIEFCIQKIIHSTDCNQYEFVKIVDNET